MQRNLCIPNTTTMRFLFLLIVFTLPALAFSQYKNQHEMLSNYTSGNYSVYRNDQGKLDKVNKQWPVTITRNADNKVENVLVKRAGVVDELFVPDLPEQPGYFSYESAKLIFFDNYAVYYKQINGSTNSSITYEVLYELIPANGDSKSLKAAAEDIAAYRTAALNSQTTIRTEMAQNKEAAEQKERDQNSIKNKTVKSLTIQLMDKPASIGLFSKLKFGVIATLADGFQLKTTNLGGKAAFEDSYIIEAPGCSFADGTLEIGSDAALFPNDELVLSIANKYNPSQKITQHITIDYGTPIFLYSTGGAGRNGSMGSDGSGWCPNVGSGKAGNNGDMGISGGDITIRIKEITHRKTGTPLYQYEIIKNKEHQTIRVKSSPSASIHIICNGGNGGDGGNGGNGGKSTQCGQGNGGKGGNGGNITIIRSAASVQATYFNIENKAGNGGTGGKAGRGLIAGNNGASGLPGNDGAIDVNNGAVSFSW
ncbi:MAG: hypothetical protein NTW29_04215 [Bacteroidetes bacterium]|nr:hypothetical protein [Bacteroidota bacterium]